MISKKKTDDRKKLKNLAKIAGIFLLMRLVIYIVPGKAGGLFIELLWAPLILLIFALPFYAFEEILDRIKKDE